MRSTDTDEASKSAWMKVYPDTSYQIVEFTSAGDHAYINTNDAMDIRGYKCGGTHCATKATKGAHVIRMTEWPKYRVGRATIICPCCQCEIFIGRTVDALGVLEFSRAAFGFSIFDLWDRPLRQFCDQGFVHRILALTQAQGVLSGHVSRYLKFLQLMKESESTLIPTLDIDLLWHTHQLSPVAYKKYCKKYLGRQINHIDTIRAKTRSTRQDDTARLWATRYSEPYLDPEYTANTTAIKRRNSIWEENQNGIEAKVAAYGHSHQDLKKELDEANNRLATNRTGTSFRRKAASVLDVAMLGVDTAKVSVKPALRLLKLRYYRQSQRQQPRKLEAQGHLLEECTYKRHEVETLEGGSRTLLQEQDRLSNKWEEAEKKRRLLEQRLTVEVTLATEAILQFNVDETDRHDDNHQQQFQEDWYNGSWYSIVPSEVQSHVHPIVDEVDDSTSKLRISRVGGYRGGGGGGGCGGGGESGTAEGCGGGGGGGCGGGGCGGG